MVYFASADEQRQIERGLLPEVRRHGVAVDLRGWNWQRPPLQPVYRPALGVSEIASKYCPTGRDLFLRRVEHVRAPVTEEMRRGQLYHALLADLVMATKQHVYARGADCLDSLEQHLAKSCVMDTDAGARVDPVTQQRLRALWSFESRRLGERVSEVLSRHPHVESDALALLALPLNVELKLDGRHLGLSQHLSADGVSFPHLMVFEVKFGRREEFHQLTTAGYALVVESLFEVPIDLGCVVYVGFAGDRVTVEREYHIIDDELRQMFIEERDEKARAVGEEIDPGLPDRCPSSCPYLRTCYPLGLSAGSGRPASANLTVPSLDGATPAA